MKKVLTIVAVALLATSTVFAGVSFGGKFQGGYVINFEDKITVQDFEAGAPTVGDAALDGRLNLSVKDDNGYWSINIDAISGQYNTNKTGNLDLTVNLDKVLKGAYDVDMPISLALNIGFDDRQAGLRSFSNKSALNLDRIRTQSSATNMTKSNSFFGGTVGYGSMIKVNGEYSPSLKSGIVGVQTQPIDGLSISADWVKNGQLNTSLLKTAATEDNLLSAAANVNVAKLMDADFNLGASVAYAFVQDSGNQIAAEVYGGAKGFSAYGTFGMGLNNDDDSVYALYVGGDLAMVKDLDIELYFGADDLSNFAETWAVGGTVGYNMAGIGLNLNAEYATASGLNVTTTGLKGFSLTPYVVVSF